MVYFKDREVNLSSIIAFFSDIFYNKVMII